MTKRISQANTVVVPVAEAHVAEGKAVAAKAVAVPAEAAAEVVTAEVVVEKPAVTVTVVADPIVALAAPAPMAMVAEPAAAAEPAATASSSAAVQDGGDGTDLTPYIVGGVLVLGGVLAVALSSGDTDPIPVTPAPANTAPNFTSATTASVAENAPIATIVYDANASDTQGNAIVFTIGGTDAALFNIDATTGVVTLRNSANFEAKPTYSFTVTATDNGTPALSTTQTVTVTVTNVNEQPTFASATATATVPENIPTTQVVFDANASDPDAVGQPSPLPNPPPAGVVLTYTLGGADAASFTIDAATGEVRFRASPDFEAKATYTFTVTATDNATPALSATQTVTVNVTDVAEGPVFTSGATASIAENSATSTVVYDAEATGATSFAIGGADAALFDFDTTTGVVTFRASPDFEARSTYNITITATGPAGTSTQPVAVTVTNVNETPAFTATTRTTTVAENVAAGSTVFAAGGATDPDGTAAPNTLTYTLTGADAAAFAVNAQTGAVTFVGSPNFEAQSSFTFNLVATDQNGLAATQVNTVVITDVNEAPTFAAATRTATLDENVAAGTVVPGSAVATDPDAGATVTYTLTGADAALFTINATTGVVTLIGSPDFETRPVYNFNVVATDQGGLSSTQAVTLNINDIVVEGVRIDGPGIPAGTVATYSAATGNVIFLESGAAGNLSTISSFTAGDIIRTDVATSNYSFSSDGTTLIISYNNGGIVSEIRLPNAVSVDALITSELAAEQAVGFDFFQSSIPPAPPASGSLDAAGPALTAYDAGTAANTYTDNVAQANTSTINNFNRDDVIVLTGVTGGQTANFSSDGSDLVVDFNNGGIVSRIVITNVVNPNGPIISDEASAEAAIGFDFFRYG